MSHPRVLGFISWRFFCYNKVAFVGRCQAVNASCWLSLVLVRFPGTFIHNLAIHKEINSCVLWEMGFSLSTVNSSGCIECWVGAKVMKMNGQKGDWDHQPLRNERSFRLMHHKIQPCENKTSKVYETIDVMKKAPFAIYRMKINVFSYIIGFIQVFFHRNIVVWRIGRKMMILRLFHRLFHWEKENNYFF